MNAYQMDEMLEHSCNGCGRMEDAGETFGNDERGLLECPGCKDERLAAEEMSEAYERIPA